MEPDILKAASRYRGSQLYVVGWAELEIVKVGWTSLGRRRWGRFLASGGELLFVHNGPESGKAEHTLERSLIRYPRAFQRREESLGILPKGGGYTECRRIPPSQWGHVIDLARASI